MDKEEKSKGKELNGDGLKIRLKITRKMIVLKLFLN